MSEIRDLIIYPYKVSELKRILENNKDEFKTLQDVIDKKYTKKLSSCKNAYIERFKEAFLLMKNKENASFGDCLDLALELFGKKYLNPPIIRACRNLDELDIYLDCLETNELEDFPFFKVQYELYSLSDKKNNNLLLSENT